jgi:hypothetical protein
LAHRRDLQRPDGHHDHLALSKQQEWKQAAIIRQELRCIDADTEVAAMTVLDKFSQIVTNS